MKPSLRSSPARRTARLVGRPPRETETGGPASAFSAGRSAGGGAAALRSMTMTDEPVKAGVTLSAPVDHVFRVFAERIGDWWPRTYTFSGDAHAVIENEPLRGCRSLGDQVRLRGSDWLERASEVEVRFLALGPKLTRVEVEHRGFARHGAGAELLRGGMASSDGWPYILRQYAEAASPTARAVLSA